MTFLAYLLRSWWKLQLAFAFFSLLLSSYYFLVPESPRWLLENGRSKEAKAVLLKIAQVNSTNIDETKFHVHFEELERRILNEEERKDNVKRMVKLCREHGLRIPSTFMTIPDRPKILQAN